MDRPAWTVLVRAMRATLAGELLAAPVERLSPTSLAWLTGAPASSSRRELLERAHCDEALVSAMVAAARRRGSGDPERAALRALLPPFGFVLASAEDVLILAQAARPAHAPFLVRSLDLVPPERRPEIAEALFNLGHPAGEALLRRQAHDPNSGVAAAALGALARLRIEPGIALLERAFASDDPRVHAAALLGVRDLELPLRPSLALAALAWARGEAAGDVLEAAARHPDGSELGSLVVAAFDQKDFVADPEAVAQWLFSGGVREWNALARNVAFHPRPEMRARAAEALGRVTPPGDRASLALLERLAGDRDLRVRVQAARALGARRHDFARAALAMLARDREALVREEAALSLGRHGPYHVIPVLRKLGRDDDPWVRNAAQIALVQHGVMDGILSLDADRDDLVLGPRTRRVLGMLRRPSVPRFSDELRGREPVETEIRR